MMIGMMSDSHGDVERTRRAPVHLRKPGVEFVLHAGDFGGGAVLDVLSEELGVHDIPVRVVEGNTDRSGGGVRSYVTGPGVQVSPGARWQGTLGGCRVALLHGDDQRALDYLLHSKSCDLIVSGHTHVRACRMTGGVICLNPGALHRTAEPGTAWYDTASGRCVFVDV